MGRGEQSGRVLLYGRRALDPHKLAEHALRHGDPEPALVLVRAGKASLELTDLLLEHLLAAAQGKEDRSEQAILMARARLLLPELAALEPEDVVEALRASEELGREALLCPLERPGSLARAQIERERSGWSDPDPAARRAALESTAEFLRSSDGLRAPLLTGYTEELLQVLLRGPFGHQEPEREWESQPWAAYVPRLCWAFARFCGNPSYEHDPYALQEHLRKHLVPSLRALCVKQGQFPESADVEELGRREAMLFALSALRSLRLDPDLLAMIEEPRARLRALELLMDQTGERRWPLGPGLLLFDEHLLIEDEERAITQLLEWFEDGLFRGGEQAARERVGSELVGLLEAKLG